MTQRIYTGTGDRGETGLFGGARVPKSHPRVVAYGTVDELNAVLGWTLTQTQHATIRERLAAIQPDLFAIGAHLASVARERATPPKLPPLPESRIPVLEHWIDEADDELPELHAFIMPGGAPGGAALHVARTVCRRAEREIVHLAQSDAVALEIIVYLNRLADLLFVWARLENRSAGVDEQQWRPDSR